MGVNCLEKYRRSAPIIELEGGNKSERRLEEGDRGGHGKKMCPGAIEREDIVVLRVL